MFIEAVSPRSYQPVIIERMLFQTPETSTIARCTTTKMTSPDAARKWMRRAVWRPPKSGKKLRHSGVDARRHGEARQHDERKQHEHHREIGELLQHIVALRRFPAREAQAQMVEDVGADMAKLREARQKVAPEMAAREAEDRNRQGRSARGARRRRNATSCPCARS